MKQTLRLILFLMLPFFATAQWSSSATVNTPVETTTGCVLDSFAVIPYMPLTRDALGNYFTAWSDNRTSPYQVYVQKLNTNGQVQWTMNGVKAAASVNFQANPEIVPDGSGGCFVTWNEETGTSTPPNWERDIKAQHLNSSGIAQWGASGVVVCNAANEQIFSRIVADGAGGVVIGWIDERSSISRPIYAQRLNSSGVAQWAENGIIVNNTGSSSFWVFNILQENTNTIFVWEETVTGNLNVYAQKLNASGAKQWGISGVSVATTTQNESYSKAIIDAAGNVYIAFEHSTNPGESDIYVQKLNPSGAVQWTVNGVVICNEPDEQLRPEIIHDNSGGAFVTWSDDRDSDDKQVVFVQRVNNEGIAQFTANGIQLVTTPEVSHGFPNMVTDGAGGAIISFYDGRALPGNLDIYSQRINAAGAIQWAAGGVFTARPITGDIGLRGVHQIVAADDGAVISFSDNRVSNTSCFNVYVQRINTNGTLGNIPAAVTNISLQQAKISLYPTLAHDHLLIENGNNFRVTLRLIDMNGRQVMNRVVGSSNKQIIDISSLQNGVYIAEIQLNNGKRVTQKIVKQ